MFGGKTIQAIIDYQRAEIAGRKVQSFRIAWDNRYSEGYITSNNGQLKYPAIVSPDFEDMCSKVNPLTEVLLIDELQFWDERILDFLREEQIKRKIISTALQRDFRGRPFPLRAIGDEERDSTKTMGDAMALSTTLKQFWSICDFLEPSGEKCGAAAYFCQRRRPDGQLSEYEDATIVVGGKNSYQPVCREHFIVPLPGGKFREPTHKR